ncbi:hypothetical protein [Desulfofustis glycolicus]|uniref:CARDB domain-containing protein n=1 Tax=Desulfofustis glycolicus DSM 9705 TaxID=1121409 RepID=A0A1M5V789_9BACT|nr:hypothetical protein [Desulfofustis glycolicus]MCB2214935.1 hypothetical protein [Desulfobulbaceae bacterium]SHH71087.1 hypothetical protein SAMN02745124_01544 [Desulfofustis glycolicus DSM 9705]
MPSDNSRSFARLCSIILVGAVVLLTAGTALAETKHNIVDKRNSTLPGAANIPTRQLCADLSVNLKLTKSSTGLLTLSGVVTNVGNADFTAAARTSFFMNVRYLPKSYNQTGISEELCPASFAPLKKGASRPVVCKYQIPDFKRWADHPSLRENTMRLFTLSVKPAGPSNFQAGEECNQANNANHVEIGYLK